MFSNHGRKSRLNTLEGNKNCLVIKDKNNKMQRFNMVTIA